MTTRVHIVNLGPSLVEVSVPQSDSVHKILYHGDSHNEYVYDNYDVLVTEKPIIKSVEEDNVA